MLCLGQTHCFLLRHLSLTAAFFCLMTPHVSLRHLHHSPLVCLDLYSFSLSLVGSFSFSYIVSQWLSSACFLYLLFT